MQSSEPRLRAAFAGAPRRTRWHTALRWAVAPMASVEASLPAAGAILEIGCGHGLFSIFCALESHSRQIVGVDIDERKIDEARAAAHRAGLTNDRVRFEVVDQAWTPSGADQWDAVVIIDVLYLLGTERALRLLDDAAASITPSGRLLVKEVDTTRWRRMALLTVEEWFMTGVGATRGDAVQMLPTERIERGLRDAGMDTTRRDLSKGFHVPHCLVVADPRQ